MNKYSNLKEFLADRGWTKGPGSEMYAKLSSKGVFVPAKVVISTPVSAEEASAMPWLEDGVRLDGEDGEIIFFALYGANNLVINMRPADILYLEYSDREPETLLMDSLIREAYLSVFDSNKDHMPIPESLRNRILDNEVELVNFHVSFFGDALLSDLQ